MITLKGCPKCKGDLYLDRDAYGVFRQCLQCGYVKDIAEPPAARPAAVPQRPRRKQAATKVAA